MKNRILLALLTLSLAGNIWLALAARTPTAARPVPAAPIPLAPKTGPGPAGGSTAEAGSPAAPPRGLRWRTPQSLADFQSLAAELRTAGLPAELRAVVLRDLYQRFLLAHSPLATAPYWRRRRVELKEQPDYLRAHAADLGQILGPDARPSLALDAVTRARRYGTLSDTNIDALAVLERDYEEMGSDLRRAAAAEGFSSDFSDYKTREKQRSLLDSEKRADVARLLSPAEFDEYERRNSASARSVARVVEDVALAAPEYDALYQHQKSFDQAQGSDDGDYLKFGQIRRAEPALWEQMRATLGEQRFHQVFSNLNSDYRKIARLGERFASLTPSAAYQVVRLQREIEGSPFSNALAAGSSPEIVRDAYAAWNARLDALLGAEAAAAVRTATGRSFRPPVAPSPANSPKK